MHDHLIISRKDRDAIVAALGAIGRTLPRLSVKGRDNEAALYVIWNNIDLIRLRLSQADSVPPN
jgi:hypothetical protein